MGITYVSSGFDPYSEWLDLNVSASPLDHYQLLGIRRFEPNATVIAEAADRALSRVRSHRPGANAQAWAHLLDQISAAKSCLTDASMRAEYDRGLVQDASHQDAVSDLSASAWPSPQAGAAAAGPNPGLAARQDTNPAPANPAEVAAPIPGYVPPQADPMAPLGVPTPQSAAPANSVPGFANSPTNVPGIQSPTMPVQAVPGVDPMAPLSTTAVPQAPIPAEPMQNAPMPGYANLVPPRGPMAPAASPIAQATVVPMAQAQAASARCARRRDYVQLRGCHQRNGSGTQQ